LTLINFVDVTNAVTATPNQPKHYIALQNL